MRVTAIAKSKVTFDLSTPPVIGALPLLCINGGLLFDHTLLWPALAALATHRQLIFFDQRGRGLLPELPVGEGEGAQGTGAPGNGNGAAQPQGN